MTRFNANDLKSYLENLKFKTYSKNKVKYINLPAAFDIETSSWEDTDKHACMYIWMMGIKDYIFYGRSWSEWDKALSVICDTLCLGAGKKLVIYVHNLAYEFQWIRKRLKWERVFALEQRKPVECFTDTGLVFKCSYLLSGESLEKVSEKLPGDYRKKSGQLDYKLIRHYKTALSDTELEYCEYDIISVLKYIEQQIKINGGKISKIPLTKTGYVRQYCRSECLPAKTGAWYRYRRVINQLTLSPDEYHLLHRAFQGGFTHACARKSHKTFTDVASYDFTSSYPACMVLEQFPMSQGFKIDRLTPELFEHYLNYFCCLFTVTLYDVDEKITADHPISASRCSRLRGEICDNGRIAAADELTITVTDVDWKIIKEFYSFTSYEVRNFYYYYRGYLPTAYVRAVLGLYKDKTELKGVEGREHDYMLSKELLNSTYGMMVTNIIRDEISYTDDWSSAPVDVAEKLKIYNESKKRFLSYAWGVWVTAYARKNLFTAIKACAADYIYADTDSIKLTNFEKYATYFEKYNTDIVKKIEKAAAHHQLDSELFMPKTIKGQTKIIGVWDFEGVYDRFKTLGAKRYMTETDGQISITVSGVNKKTAVPYIISHYKEPFEAFNNDMYIPPAYTGKNIHTYIDDGENGFVTDYKGYRVPFAEMSSVHLAECDYHLSVAQQYINYLLKITEEQI